MKKPTRKQAEKILEKKFKDVSLDDDDLWFLCMDLPDKLKYDFREYWKGVNTKKYYIMNKYLGPKREAIEVIFLRLLSAHLFIKDTYK